MGTKFTPYAARQVLDQAHWAKSQPRNDGVSGTNANGSIGYAIFILTQDIGQKDENGDDTLEFFAYGIPGYMDTGGSGDVAGWKYKKSKDHQCTAQNENGYKIWFPMACRDTDGNAKFAGLWKKGATIQAIFNGRWEFVGQPLPIRWELQEPLTFPSGTDDGGGGGGGTIPYSEGAKPLYYDFDTGKYSTTGDGSEDDDTYTADLYFPGCPQDDEGNYIQAPWFAKGQRVRASVAQYGVDAGTHTMWEITDTPAASFWAQITERSGAVYSWVAMSMGSDGTLSPDSDLGQGDNAIEVFSSNCVLVQSIVNLRPYPGGSFLVFEYAGGTVTGTLSDDIDAGDSGDVTVTTAGHNSDTIEAYNNLDGDIVASDGTTVYLSYNIQQQQWVIVSQSCNSTNGGPS